MSILSIILAMFCGLFIVQIDALITEFKVFSYKERIKELEKKLSKYEKSVDKFNKGVYE
jgi:cell division protein FtsL